MGAAVSVFMVYSSVCTSLDLPSRMATALSVQFPVIVGLLASLYSVLLEVGVLPSRV